QRVEHILVPEQPRADVLVPTSRLWPGGISRHQPPRSDAALPLGADVDEAAGRRMPSDAPGPMGILHQELAKVCTPETMVRLRLARPLALEQYHSLALREVLLYGQQHAFSLDLDTSGLSLLGESVPAPGQRAQGGGPISPAREVEALLAERLRAARDADAAADAQVAAEMV